MRRRIIVFHRMWHLFIVRLFAHGLVMIVIFSWWCLAPESFNDVVAALDEWGASIATEAAPRFGMPEPWLEEIINGKAGFGHMVLVGFPSVMVFIVIEASEIIAHWHHCVRTAILVALIPLFIILCWIEWPAAALWWYKWHTNFIAWLFKVRGYHHTYTFAKWLIPIHIVVYLEILLGWSLLSGFVRHNYQRWRET